MCRFTFRSGMNQAIEHLSQLHHQKIGYIGGSAGLTISDHRQQAFEKAMGGLDFRLIREFVRVGNYRIQWWGGRDGGTAGDEGSGQLRFMAANDLTAIGALRVIHRRGLSVPGDFSVVGFDDIELSDVVYPPLTTIRLPRHRLAEMFVTALESSAKDSHAVGKQYTVKTSLVVRSSTGPVRRRK